MQKVAIVAEKVVEEIEASGGKATAFQADVSQPDQIAALFDHAEQT